MKLFHGTLSTRLPAIYKHGIKPRGAAAGNWSDLGGSRPDAVYLTDAHALHYALQAMWAEGQEREQRSWKLHVQQRPRAWLAQSDERKRRKVAREIERQFRARAREIVPLPVVIEVDTDKLNPLNLIPDEDAIEQSLNYNGVMQHLSPAELLAWCRERVHRFAGHHDLSLRTLGTCAHLGTIPPTAITRVAVVDPDKAPHLFHYARINSCNIIRFAEVGGQLRDLNRWIFGEAHKYFEGPPEEEREGIRITELSRKAA